MLLSPLVVRELALRLVLDVMVVCLVPNAVATFPTPVMVTLAADTEFTLRLLFVDSASCFAAMVVAMSVPFKYKGPVIRALLPHTMLPVTSKDCALTAQLNVALLLVSPSRSTLFESAKRSV